MRRDPACTWRYDGPRMDLATTHLIGLGHRHIALAGPDLDADPNFRQRREGYRRALAEHGLQPHYFTSRSQGMHAVG